MFQSHFNVLGCNVEVVPWLVSRFLMVEDLHGQNENLKITSKRFNK